MDHLPLSKLMAVRPVTLKRIADQLGLSVTTVARSLKDGHKISAETVQRVRDTADALGYIRNLDGLRLRTGRSFTLMAFLANRTDTLGREDGFLMGLHRRLGHSDYALRVMPATDRNAALPLIRDAMRSRQADGFILDDVTPDDLRVQMLLDHDFPFVTLGRAAMADHHAWVDLDHAEFAAQSTAALVAKGRRRIALVGWNGAHGARWSEGYRSALAAAGLAYDPALVLWHEDATQALRHAVADLCRCSRPDAFVCADEDTLLATLDGLRDAGTRSVDETDFAVGRASHVLKHLGIRVTAAHSAAESVGWDLADLLLRRIDGEPATNLQRLVHPTLHQFV